MLPGMSVPSVSMHSVGPDTPSSQGTWFGTLNGHLSTMSKDREMKQKRRAEKDLKAKIYKDWSLQLKELKIVAIKENTHSMDEHNCIQDLSTRVSARALRFALEVANQNDGRTDHQQEKSRQVHAAWDDYDFLDDDDDKNRGVHEE